VTQFDSLYSISEWSPRVDQVHEGGRNPAFLFSPYGTKAEGRLFVVPFLLLRQLADSQGKAGLEPG